MNENEDLSKIQSRLDNWAVMQMTDEQKSQWMQDNVISQIAQISAAGDLVEEVIVLDELYEVLSIALDEAKLPDKFPDQEGLDRAQVAEEFQKFCRSILVRSTTLASLNLENIDDVEDVVLFIRPVTRSMRTNGFLDSWDQSIGLSQLLRSRGCPFLPTPNEKKLLFMISQMFDAMALSHQRQQQQQIQIPNGQEVELFKMDQ